ncbi:hypothetical protein [Arenimonas sp. MALMAid1274]|uniref:hypothetical protein n=1 Tax=Arenimonas sp. MALMAid1274 TaxID=3411630 RepID=UPI003BA184E4
MTAAPVKPARRRRWPWVLAVLAVLAGVAAWWVDRQLEPTRLTATVLQRLGDSLGLELRIDGSPEYALRPEPRLVLPGLTARQPGAARPLLSAARAEVSLPWDTILGGESLVITRVQLDQPLLDLAALSAWQATRPESPFELPTFTDGVYVNDGSVVGDGWRIGGLSLSLPRLAPDEAADAEVAFIYSGDGTTLDFEGRLAIAKASLQSDFSAGGNGRLRMDAVDAPMTLDLGGSFDASTDTTLLTLDSITLDSQSPLPSFKASGEARFGDRLGFKLAGQLQAWPEDWPALPEPLSTSEAPFDFSLAYEGDTDLADPLSLRLVQDQTRLDTELAVPEVLAWLDKASASPLPPLVGRMETPQLSVGGATLEGVRVRIEEDAPAAAPAQDAQ